MNRLLLLGSALLWVLSACGGGSGGGTSTYTVTASAGVNGSITPITNTVASGATTFFLVTPNSGYTVDSISGCGGTLSGNTYTTAAITADCTVTVSFRSRQFVWMGGSQSVADVGDYGVQGTAAASNMPGARDSAAYWTDVSGNLWLFGGVGFTPTDSGRLNDLWKYDTNSGWWTWVSGPNTSNDTGNYGSLGVAASTNSPPSRGSASSWTDANGKFWMFGGEHIMAHQNDLWMYDPDTSQWTWMSGSNTSGAAGNYGVQGTAAASNVPGARVQAAAWADNNGNLWLFGGLNASGNLNDLWKYNISSGMWTWVSGSSSVDASATYGTQGTPALNNVPGARFGSTAWTDSNGKLWLFGGVSSSAFPAINYYNDLWKFDPDTGEWTWMSGSNTANALSNYGDQGTEAATNVPGARTSSASWTDASGKMWLFGGWGYDATTGGLLRDLWRYDPDSGNWTWMNGLDTVGTTGSFGTKGTPSASNYPGGRYSSAIWIDADDNPWLLGGYNDINELNDLWSYH